MKKQKHTSNFNDFDESIKEKRSKKSNAKTNDSYDYDYEFDSYISDEWEESFDNLRYQ